MSISKEFVQGVIIRVFKEDDLMSCSEETVVARVGMEAPDFEANAFLDNGFTRVKLSDYRGKWVMLCFYPGDFTFV